MKRSIRVFGILALVGLGAGCGASSSPVADEDQSTIAPSVVPVRPTPPGSPDQADSTPLATTSPGDSLALETLDETHIGKPSQRLRTDGRALFVLQGAGVVVRIEPATGNVAETVIWGEALAPDEVPSDLAMGGIGFVDGSLAAALSRADGTGHRLVMLDATSLDVLAVVPVADAVGPVAVFSDPAADTVGLIGSSTFGAVNDGAVISLFDTDLQGPAVDPVTADGLLWAVAPARNKIVGLDNNSGAIVRSVEVLAPTSLRFAFGSLWTGSAATGDIHRIDPTTGAIVATISPADATVTQTVVHVGADRVVATSLINSAGSPSGWVLSLVDPANDTIAHQLTVGQNPNLVPTTTFFGTDLYVVVDGVTLRRVSVGHPRSPDHLIGASTIGADLTTDEAALISVIERGLDYSQPVDPALLIRGRELGATAEATVEAARGLGRAQGLVTAVGIVGDLALATFDMLDESSNVVLSGAAVTMRRVDGMWRFDDVWFCQAAAEFGLDCPQ